MRPSTGTDFASTDEGKAFRRSYESVLGKWPVRVDSMESTSRYGTTHVNVCGRADAPALLLLPGAGATSTVWFANANTLATRFRVYALDTLGDAGLSTSHDAPMTSTNDLVSWLDAVARDIGVEEFHLAGHSYGAMIALAYALHRPDRVRRLALLDPNSCFTGMNIRYLARAVPTLLRPTEKRQRRLVDWETAGHPVDDDWLRLLGQSAAHFPASKLVVPKRPGRHELERLDVEATVVVAGHSRVHDSRRVAEVVSSRYPRIRVTRVDEATHHTLPMWPAPAVDDALLRALAE